MKIQMKRGYMVNSLTIDGKEEIDLSDNERQEVLRHIFEHLKCPGPELCTSRLGRNLWRVRVRRRTLRDSRRLCRNNYIGDIKT